ncbi:DNA repair protein RecO [Candidatus Nomurabacteria bacterium RIFCSPLOWO2_01_FULL_46_18]|uniref:DNA repair protein RecO n=1 Tax=Candidatus Nomurabacteria bacterium RIFCSPLOWO2_01_FULL_46_18 TaxID=1801783 RepID=A0A1F6XCB3_9BACT|nr:MAG: DNA repair protein RecO [Candidatus Nomurabacteria bacterium RIFCSPLOWO2_01_FULL_46_18]
MHHIYHTEGIILSSRNFGEAEKYFSIFTKDLGMITASASGVRKMSSKLRFILQDFGYLNFDLVRGKDFWRLTSASKTGELENLCKRPEVFAVVSNISRLLKRLLPGEDANPALFADLVRGLSILETAASREEIQNAEVITVLRILANLGYIGGDKINDLISQISTKRIEILSFINQTLKETHL